MTQITVYQCDGPSCMRTDDESLEEASLMEAGWLIVTNAEDEGTGYAHLCSYGCLFKWAEEQAE